MEIISLNLLKYNIGLDVGDNLTNVLFEKNSLIPNNKKISFVVPELDEEYDINIIMGDNILASDNIVLECIKLKNVKKVIHIDMFLYIHCIIININTKTNNIYSNAIKYYDNNINYKNIVIDTDFYKLKFDILQIIKLIRKRINLGSLLLDDQSKNILEEKLNNIINNIDNMTNQKMLDIKNSLKMKFFIN